MELPLVCFGGHAPNKVCKWLGSRRTYYKAGKEEKSAINLYAKWSERRHDDNIASHKPRFKIQ